MVTEASAKNDQSKSDKKAGKKDRAQKKSPAKARSRRRAETSMLEK